MGWIDQLKAGLGRTSVRLSNNIADLLKEHSLDQATLDELEDLLIASDMGVTTASRLTAAVSKNRFDQRVSADDLRRLLSTEIASILEPVAQPLKINSSFNPFVILVCGVNGAGKTTTIGKMAQHFREQGNTIMLAAGDTFRAAAIEQLQVWGERVKCPVIAKKQGSDAASLAFWAIERAREANSDVLMIDTAGRLHNKSNLMDELKKVVRVVRKLDDTAPHSILLVLDATVGQNTYSQVESFQKILNVSGLVMTKLDGTAKGGVLVGLAEEFGLPIHAIGVGESIEDLRPFDAKEFADSLLGLS